MIVPLFLWFLIGTIFGTVVGSMVVAFHGDPNMNESIRELRKTRLEAYKTHTQYVVAKFMYRELKDENMSLTKLVALHNALKDDKK